MDGLARAKELGRTRDECCELFRQAAKAGRIPSALTKGIDRGANGVRNLDAPTDDLASLLVKCGHAAGFDESMALRRTQAAISVMEEENECGLLKYRFVSHRSDDGVAFNAISFELLKRLGMSQAEFEKGLLLTETATIVSENGAASVSYLILDSRGADRAAVEDILHREMAFHLKVKSCAVRVGSFTKALMNEQQRWMHPEPQHDRLEEGPDRD